MDILSIVCNAFLSGRLLTSDALAKSVHSMFKCSTGCAKIQNSHQNSIILCKHTATRSILLYVTLHMHGKTNKQPAADVTCSSSQSTKGQLPSCTTAPLFDLPAKHVCTKDRNLPVKAELLPSLLRVLLKLELSLLYTRELCRETPLLFCQSQVALDLASTMDAFVIKAVSHSTNQAFRMRRSMPAAS